MSRGSRDHPLMRVLVVDDERALADAIVRALRACGFAADAAYDGDAALDRAATGVYDVLVLDRGLPGRSGDDVCRRLAGADAKLLMLTARDAIEERVAGLNLGADDYVPKPVAMDELVARVR